jgi:hypothetical protein
VKGELKKLHSRKLAVLYVAEMEGKVIGKWRTLHCEELYDLYSSPNIVRVIRSKRVKWVAGHVAHMADRRSTYRNFVGRPEGKRLLGSPRSIWEDNIKMDLQGVGLGGMDWIDLAQERNR